MGDPKITKKKFSAPPHPWQKSRIEEEKQLMKEYGLKNKRELWKMRSRIKGFADQAKRLTAEHSSQAKKEKEQLQHRISSLGLLPKGATMDDVLGLTVNDILERRLQTVMIRKGLARSVSQARQFITHCHVSVAGKIVTSPSYLVLSSEEGNISFTNSSPLFSQDHPERFVPEKHPGKPEEDEKPKKKAVKKKAAGKKAVKNKEHAKEKN